MKLSFNKYFLQIVFLLLWANKCFAVSYDSASELFLSGDYLSALKEFNQLHNQQPDNVNFIYGLGLIHYALDQDSEALSYLSLLSDSEYTYIARYYISMIALRNDQIEFAIDELEQLADQIEDIEVSELANESLLEIDFDSFYSIDFSDANDDGNYAFIELGLNIQDGIIDPNGLVGSNQNDSAKEIILAGSFNAFSFENSDINFGGSYFNEGYSQYESYDISATTIFIEQEGVFKQDWLSSHYWRINLSGSQIWLAEKKYLDQLEVSFFDEFYFKDDLILGLELNYQNSVNGDSNFYRYAGNSKMIGFSLQNLSHLSWLLEYSYHIKNSNDYNSIEINDSLTILDVFTSYSGDTHFFSTEVNFQINNNWHSSVGASFEKILYKDPDLYLYNTSDSLLTTAYRETKLSQFNLELVRNFSNSAFLTLGYEHIHNNSNIDFFDFNSNIFRISVSYLF